MIGGHCLAALSLAAGAVHQSCGPAEGIEPLAALSNGEWPSSCHRPQQANVMPSSAKSVA